MTQDQTYGPPNTYPAGLLFDYSVWTAATKLDLTNVPWGNDYVHVWKPTGGFDELNAYIDSHSVQNKHIENMSYARFDEPIRINVPINKVLQYNYIRASNPAQPGQSEDSARSYYYFITGARHIAPGTTQITVQLDIMMTFQDQIHFGDVYIERGHIGLANENQFNDYGREFLTIPEGQDVGSNYRIIHSESDTVISLDSVLEGGLIRENYDILVCSTTNFEDDPGDVNNPALVPAHATQFQGMPSGAQYYVFKGGHSFLLWMITQADPWVTKGIISITAIPKITRYDPEFVYTPVNAAVSPYPMRPPAGALPANIHTLKADWRESSDILNAIPARYRGLKKLLVFPYLVLELTTQTGTPIIIQPESWNDADATVTELAALIPPNQRIVFYPNGYNDNGGGGENLDHATMMGNFPTLAVINDSAIAYMAENKNGIAYQYSAADWAQQKALRGAQVSYDNTRVGIAAATDATNLGNMNNQAQLAIGSAGTGLSGAAKGAGTGGLGGAAIGAGMEGFDVIKDSVGGAMQRLTNSRMNDISKASTQKIADTNLGLAQWAANGDYQQAIAAVNATIQDSKLLQPTTSGQVGGEAFNMVNGFAEIQLRWKLIDNAHIKSIGEHWLRFGYPVMQWSTIPDSWMVMTNMTYWKCIEVNLISTSLPEVYKQAIRGIFMKGVTVWKNAGDIGNYLGIDNQALEGITL